MQLAFAPVLDALARVEAGDAAAQSDVQAELAKLKAAAEQAGEANAARNKGNGGKGHGRRDFDAERAPVEVIVLEPPERSLPGGELLVKIGEEVSEHFDYRPASVVRVVRPKYRKPATTSGGSLIITAELPERPIPCSIAGAGLIAHIITQKFCDHLPLHRQQVILKRFGVHLPRSTLANLVQGGTALLKVIVDAMWQHAREHAAWLAIDATGVLVLAAEQCRRGHFWVVVAERDHVLFRYTTKTTAAYQSICSAASMGTSSPMRPAFTTSSIARTLTSLRSPVGATREDGGLMRLLLTESERWSALVSSACSTTRTELQPIQRPA